MSRHDWRTQRKEVYKTNIRECPYCGQSISFHKLKSQKWVPVLLEEKDGRWYMPNGSGNHFNFIPVHNCRQEAENFFVQAEQKLQEMERNNSVTLSTIRKHFVSTAKDRKGLAPEMRTIIAKNFRMAKAQMRQRPSDIKAHMEWMDHLVQRATATAVFDTK